MKTRFRLAVEQAATWRLLLALLLLRCLRVGFLRGWLTPDRRRVNAHWVGSQRRPARRLRPIDLLLPVMVAQIIIFVSTALSYQSFYQAFVSNLLLVGLGVLPVFFRFQRSI